MDFYPLPTTKTALMKDLNRAEENTGDTVVNGSSFYGAASASAFCACASPFCGAYASYHSAWRSPLFVLD
jgi:hypothetical protein